MLSSKPSPPSETGICRTWAEGQTLWIPSVAALAASVELMQPLKESMATMIFFISICVYNVRSAARRVSDQNDGYVAGTVGAHDKSLFDIGRFGRSGDENTVTVFPGVNAAVSLMHVVDQLMTVENDD